MNAELLTRPNRSWDPLDVHQFEDKEKQMLGDHGFEHAVDEVARLEQAFGLDDLGKLTA